MADGRFETPAWRLARRLTEAKAEIKQLRQALRALKNDDCWCDRYYDPMCGHQKRCDQAREAVEAEGK